MEQSGQAGIHNVLPGTVFGSSVQAGVVHGGVHLHQSVSAAGPSPVPHQIPAPPDGFVGRATELRHLDQIRQRVGRVRTVVITGAAGVGKTALALRWAARARRHFPDGELYADLDAFAPTGPAAPGTVLGRFLRSLGVPAERVPGDVPEQLGLLRTLLAERRMFVLLDNAVSASQVRQLLPGVPGCMVVVTARWRLAGLVADGAAVLPVGLLDDRESTQLLAARIGDERVRAEPDAARVLVRCCGRLPLALSIMAARLAVHPGWPVRRVAAELGDEQERLAALATHETHEDLSVQATLDLTYAALPPEMARCYHAMGLHPGPHPGPAVITAALGTSPRAAATLLDGLVEAGLANDPGDDRYQLHDLVRLHARQHARRDPERAEMRRRIAEWYLAGVRAADRLLTPYRQRFPVPFAHLDADAVALPDRADALDWLERERDNLVATVVEMAPDLPELSWLIADSLWPLFHLRRHHDDRMLVDRTAVECARRLGNEVFEALMLKRLAFAYFDRGGYTEAATLFRASRALFETLGDERGVADSAEGLGQVALARAELTAAAGYFTEQLATFQRLGESRRAALASLNLGTVANAAGEPARAIGYLHDIGALDEYNAARCRIERGRALTALGEYRRSAEELTAALARMTALGSPRGEAQARHALGQAALTAGEVSTGTAHLHQAMDIYQRLGDSEAEVVRQLLATIPPAEADPDRVA